MLSVIIVHILESFFCIHRGTYHICVNGRMIVEVVLSSLYNSLANHTNTYHDSLYFSSLIFTKFYY